MTRASLKQIGDLTDALYLKSRTEFRALTEEENRIRLLISGLDAKDRTAQIALSEDHTIRSLGKDMTWRRWSEQKRQELNMQLSMVLARKESALSGLQKAFGKKTSVEGLIEKERAEFRDRRIKRDNDTLQELTLLHKVSFD